MLMNTEQITDKTLQASIPPGIRKALEDACMLTVQSKNDSIPNGSLVIIDKGKTKLESGFIYAMALDPKAKLFIFRRILIDGDNIFQGTGNCWAGNPEGRYFGYHKDVFLSRFTVIGKVMFMMRPDIHLFETM